LKSCCAITRRRFVRCLTTLSLASASTAYLSTAMAQTWPSRTVTLVVPSVAGSAPDTYARALAERLAKATGATFLVENKPAASGNVAAESVLRAPMDGHTWLISTQALMTINPSTFSGLKWKTSDFKGVVKGVEAPLVLVTSAAAPVKSFNELKTWLQRDKGKIAYASFSAGTPSHFLGHQLSDKLDAAMIHVPYKGSAPQVTDLVGGQVLVGFSQMATAMPHVQSGKLNAVAQTGALRSRLLPQVPTMAELGFPDLTSAVWFGVVLPAATPQATFDLIQAEVVKAHQDRELRARLEAVGFDMADRQTGSAFDQAMSEETTRWAGVVKATGFKAVD
jgi:tripartite-type tricarboxylate transporter receptor subunit TctC